MSRDRDGRFGKLRALLAATGESRAEELVDGYGQKGRSGVGPVVYVLVRREVVAPGALAVPDEADRVDLHYQCRRAALVAGLRVDDMYGAEGHVRGVDALGVLVQEETEVGGRFVSCGDREEHRIAFS